VHITRGHKSFNIRIIIYILTFQLFLLSGISFAQQVGNFSSYTTSGRSVLIKSASGDTIRITPYGNYMVRIQTVNSGAAFYADDHYEMVESHDWNGTLAVESSDSSLTITTGASDGIGISITKNPMRLSFTLKSNNTTVLKEKDGTVWNGNVVTEYFTSTTNEHFSGLGNEYRGHVEKVDRAGTSLKVSSGSEGACVVPFYVSSKGYGVFLNTTFTHTITLCKDTIYSLEINGEGYGGRMDYFFIAGPTIPEVVNRYTQLTGRPRLPQKSIFGLQLSDKSDPSNNGESWWKSMIKNHRDSGYAIDHQVNDNVWRSSADNSATSTQANSWFAFNPIRYPDPAEYKRWCDTNGITVTLDLNRPGLSITPGWSDSLYGMSGTSACPDLTKPAARKWLWNLFYSKALNPSLGYPGDAIWLDEFDYPDQAHSLALYSGKKWAEESINYQFDLLKGCVQEGWDSAIGESKRPYFWSRGITAGAQRFGIYWTGDLDGNYGEMRYQVRAMQSSGLSGFPYFNHDAGAHANLTVDNDNIYRQWDMAFGCFTPIWKPHGPSHSRWPNQRNSTCKGTAKQFITTRYQLIPYIYTYAYLAHSTGIPMVRPMFFYDQTNSTAWQKDMQYYFGNEFIVAPNCTTGNNNVSVWLPEGNWYDFWNDKKYTGNQTLSYYAAIGVLPVFTKEGSIIPMSPFAKSTFFIPQDSLLIHVYTGADGSFQLYEDDGVTEKFRTKNEFRTTDIKYTQNELGVEVQAATGDFTGALDHRAYRIIYHGLSASTTLYCDTSSIKSYSKLSSIPANTNGTYWDSTNKLLYVNIASRSVNSMFTVAKISTNVSNMARNISANHIIRIFNNRIVVNLSSSADLHLEVHKLNGAKIHTFGKPTHSTDSYQEFSLKSLGLSKGIYIVKVKAGNTELVRQIILP